MVHNLIFEIIASSPSGDPLATASKISIIILGLIPGYTAVVHEWLLIGIHEQRYIDKKGDRQNTCRLDTQLVECLPVKPEVIGSNLALINLVGSTPQTNIIQENK